MVERTFFLHPPWGNTAPTSRKKFFWNPLDAFMFRCHLPVGNALTEESSYFQKNWLYAGQRIFFTTWGGGRGGTHFGGVKSGVPFLENGGKPRLGVSLHWRGAIQPQPPPIEFQPDRPPPPPPSLQKKISDAGSGPYRKAW